MQSVSKKLSSITVLLLALALVPFGLRGQTVIPDTGVRPMSDAGDPGFIWRVHQTEAGQSNSNARTEAQLAGDLGENVADELAVGIAIGEGKKGGINDPIEFEIDSVINLSQNEGDNNGSFTPDDQMPGIPGILGSTDAIAAEILTWLPLDAGVHEFIVNSDDGFRMTLGGGNPKDKFSVKVGEFNGGRGAADTAFKVEIKTAGLYPARIIWEEGGGGANIEFVVRVDGNKFLVNDVDSPVKAFRTVKGGVTGVFASKVVPAPGATGIGPDSAIEVELEGASAINTSDVSLSLDGAAVAASVTKAGDTISVSFTPPELFASGSDHDVSLSYGATTQTWSFTVLTFATLTAMDQVTPDTSKRGFLWNVHQNAAAGTGNSNARAEQQLTGQIKDADGNPIENLADPLAVGGADGRAKDPNPISAPITFEVSKVINFDQDGVDQGSIPGDDFLPGIPGLDGGADSIAAEIITFIELPAGVTMMGVNSDDGFRTTAGQFGDVFAPPQVAGEFNGGRGASDTLFPVVVKDAGVYAFRTIWEEGGGGANIEWFIVKSDGSRALLNDDANGGLKTFRAALPGESKAVAQKVVPAPGQGGVALDAGILVELLDGGNPIDTATVSLSLDNAKVAADVSKSGGVTTITFTPGTPFLPKSKHVATLSYTDGTEMITRTWDFTAFNDDLLAFWDFNDASNDKVALDKVTALAGNFQNDAVFTPDGEGHTGKPGDRAVDFGETSEMQFVLVPDAGEFLNLAAAQDQITFSLWQKWNTDPVNNSAFWAVSPSTGANNRGAQAHIPWGNGSIFFDTAGCCGSDTRITSPIDNFDDFTGPDWWLDWHHFAFTKNGSLKQVWIDGKLFLEGNNISPLPTDFTFMVIGSEPNGDRSSHTKVDDFAVFAAALSPSDIGALANGKRPDEIREIVPPSAGEIQKIEFSGGNVVITFSGVLQSSDKVEGPFVPVAGASSPFTVAPDQEALFFLAR